MGKDIEALRKKTVLMPPEGGHYPLDTFRQVMEYVASHPDELVYYEDKGVSVPVGRNYTADELMRKHNGAYMNDFRKILDRQ